MIKMFPALTLPVNYTECSPSYRAIVRREYIRIQEGKCYFCNTLLIGEPSKQVMIKKINTKLFPEGFFNYPFHLHHDHNTGMTIGAVHARCNAYLWQYQGE